MQMAKRVPRRMKVIVSPFVMSPLGPSVNSPRKPPGNTWEKTFGNYCFRATCHITGGEGGKVTGYDKTMKVGDDVENACRLVVGKDASRVCSEASIVMLPSSPRTCGGEIFLIADGEAKRLV